MLALDPNDVKAYANLGTAFLSKGMMDEAIANLSKALSLDPDHAQAHNNLALAYYAIGKYELAVKYYDKAMELGIRPHQYFLDLLKPHRYRLPPQL